MSNQHLRCINCNIWQSNHSLGLRPIEEECILLVIQQWVAPQVVNRSDYICQGCRDLVVNALRRDEELSSPMTAHRKVCVNCGRSVLRTRYHILHTNTERERRIHAVISEWILPQTISRAQALICHGCWMKANRKACRFMNGLSESSASVDVTDESTSQSTTKLTVTQATAQENPQMRPFLEKEEGKEKAVPNEIPCSTQVSTPTSRNIRVEDADICDDNVEDAADDSDALAESNDEAAGICDNMDDAEDDSNTLVESNVCRVCLAMDVKMYDLKDTELRGMFQNVTGICVPENNHSVLERLCWECVGRLKTAAAFRNKALVSDTLLQGLASTGEQIRKIDITTIKENKEYLRPAGTLSVVEVFHPVDIDPENDSVPHILENNDTNIVEHTVGKDSYEIKKENIIDEDNDQMMIKDEPMNEIPIKTETEYDQFDYLYPNTGEESRNVFTETNPLVSNDISLTENKINLPDSSPLPGCSHADPKYPVVGSLQNTLNNCKDKIKRNAIVINKKDLSAKIVLKKPKVLLTDKSKTLNVIMGGVRKKILIINKATKTQVNTHTGEE